ncbi:hypothetical protein [Phytobacter diazotrophicus]|uniref:hypothetical protein n=1 Tax=Phytobacter diazotrophicus TaxID=395631 RepID=UPI002FF90574
MSSSSFVRRETPIANDEYNVHNLNTGYDGSGGGGSMLERVKNLEDKVASLGTDIAVIKATMCTKEDLHKELNGQTWKIVIALIITVLIAILSKYFIK